MFIRELQTKTEREYSIYGDDIMTKKNNLEILDNLQQPVPVSFKVIGTGTGATGIIEKVKSFGYDCVSCIIAESPSECIPMDDDKMVIIVARDNEDVANMIAKTYHDAGVLTLGLLEEADITCFDSVIKNTSGKDYPNIIKALLQPIVTEGYICYDFNDLCTTLRDTRFFKTLIAEGKDVETSVAKMQTAFDSEGVEVSRIEYLSAHLYCNRQRQPAITMKDLAYLSDMLSKMPESMNTIWSMNIDNMMASDQIRFTIIMSGKEI